MLDATVAAAIAVGLSTIGCGGQTNNETTHKYTTTASDQLSGTHAAFLTEAHSCEDGDILAIDGMRIVEEHGGVCTTYTYSNYYKDNTAIRAIDGDSETFWRVVTHATDYQDTQTRVIIKIAEDCLPTAIDYDIRWDKKVRHAGHAIIRFDVSADGEMWTEGSNIETDIHGQQPQLSLSSLDPASVRYIRFVWVDGKDTGDSGWNGWGSIHEIGPVCAPDVPPEPEITYPIDDALVDGEWHWVPDVPGAQCGRPIVDPSGDTLPNKTGLGVNFNESSDKLMIYFQGGGACWNEETCGNNGPIIAYNADGTLSLERIGAMNLRGYDAEQFSKDVATPLEAPVTPAVLLKDLSVSVPLPSWLGGDLEFSQNISPFADAQMVFFPYCTGDVFSGRNSAAHETGVVHAGALNVDAYIRQLRHVFDQPERTAPTDIYLIGSSAGGFGAITNLDAFVAAFPEAKIHILSDSGVLLKRQPENTEGIEREHIIREAWSYQAPSDCDACADSLFDILPYYLKKYDDQMDYTLMSYLSDPLIADFFEYDYDCELPDSLAFLMDSTNIDGELKRDFPNFYHATSTLHGHTMLEFLYLPLYAAIETVVDAIPDPPFPLPAIDMELLLNLLAENNIIPEEVVNILQQLDPPFTEDLGEWLVAFRTGEHPNLGEVPNVSEECNQPTDPLP